MYSCAWIQRLERLNVHNYYASCVRRALFVHKKSYCEVDVSEGGCVAISATGEVYQ